MDIIFSGSLCPNPAELLEHNRFHLLLQKLREKYDYVIVDTLPLGSVIDSAIVAKIADGAILVIESNAIIYRFAQNVKAQLDKSGCKILGAILNKIPMESKGIMVNIMASIMGHIMEPMVLKKRKEKRKRRIK
jgi:capsular exopolysaccharide synthesis family protein